MWIIRQNENNQLGKLFIKLLILILLLGAISCNEASKKVAGKKPNIIIFLADDLGYGDLPSYGHPVIKTPNLDKLAASGLKLNRCYSASPVCSPSRAGLITGKMPNRLGIYEWIPEESVMHIPDSVLTIPAMLREKGYSTGLFGKWHCNGKFNSPHQPQPDDLGFDHWIATQNNAIPSHENPTNFVRNRQEMGEMKGFSAQVMADEVIGWLEGLEVDEPFFCYVAFHEPHEPVASPQELVTQYMDQAINEDQAQYFANVTNMDLAIGRILEKVKALGKDENTLVIFTSDNGPETLGRYNGVNRSYGSPGELRGMKVHLYEGGVRVPGIVSWPGIVEEGQVSDAVVSSLDFLPTIASIVGEELPVNEVLDGENILPFLKGEEHQRKKDLFWFYPTSVDGPNISLLSGIYKVMAESQFQYLEPGNTVGIIIGDRTMDGIKSDSVSEIYEFYDLNVYPSEEQNLPAGKSAVLDTLKTDLQERFYELRASSPDLDFGFE